MKINGKYYRSIWTDPAKPNSFFIFDQRDLPHQLSPEEIQTWWQAAVAIKDMHTRGAPLIGMTAAYGMVLAAVENLASPDLLGTLKGIGDQLKATRPTAVNLAWAVDRQIACAEKSQGSNSDLAQALRKQADEMADEDAQTCKKIGEHGLKLIREIAARKSGPVNILTHCNAGWLACVDYGTATAPMYLAHDEGIPIHVWVDETRPRNQGAKLTAFELGQHGIPHTLVADNTGGHLMQHGMVDICLVGADRVTRCGDAANKIGTYLKALAAHDNGVPFYVCVPGSTFDWGMRDGLKEIEIEQRGDEEVKYMDGLDADGMIRNVLITPSSSPAANFGFDVTPARLVTGIITERGISPANESGLVSLYPEKA
jgi:methylthioribose-1-phosphate isomerase